MAITHKAVGTSLSQTEWEAADSHEGLHGIAQHTDVSRDFFIPACSGYSTGVQGFISSYWPVVILADGASLIAYLSMKVPNDFVSFTSVKAVWSSPAAAGNMRWRIMAGYNADGEALNFHSDGPAEGVTATGGADIVNVQEPANPLALANLAKGDYIGFRLSRDGTAGTDTLNDAVNIIGILFTYVAEQ